MRDVGIALRVANRGNGIAVTGANAEDSFHFSICRIVCLDVSRPTLPPRLRRFLPPRPSLCDVSQCASAPVRAPKKNERCAAVFVWVRSHEHSCRRIDQFLARILPGHPHDLLAPLERRCPEPLEIIQLPRSMPAAAPSDLAAGIVLRPVTL